MEAFLGNKKIKAKYLRRVRAHQKADQVVKGRYWEEGKGCAVGCTIHSDDHSAYEMELGIPEWLARVEDVIFEGLPNERAMRWPSEFLSAIKVGVDLEKVKTPFVIFILENCLESMAKVQFDAVKFPDVKKALESSKAAVVEMIRCHREGLSLLAARSAAESAARSAESAAWSAAESAARSAAWSAAESAAWLAARSAWSAAWSAESAAWSAESAARSAWSAAWSAAPGPGFDGMDWEKGKEAFEREFIVQALKKNRGRINLTAKQANIPKNTLLRKIKKYSINPKEYGMTESVKYADKLLALLRECE